MYNHILELSNGSLSSDMFGNELRAVIIPESGSNLKKSSKKNLTDI